MQKIFLKTEEVMDHSKSSLNTLESSLASLLQVPAKCAVLK